MKLKLTIAFLCVISFLLGGSTHAQTAAEQNLTNLVAQATKTFPVPPANSKMLFYLQRNKNSNTVVYEANIGKDGKLDPDEPVKVYWIRYTEGGVIKELSWIQRWLAFGVDAEPSKENPGSYIVSFVALKQRKVTVSLDATGKPSAVTPLNGKPSRLSRLYAQAQETNWLPTVKFIQLKGEDVKTKQEVYEYIFPKQQ